MKLVAYGYNKNRLTSNRMKPYDVTETEIEGVYKISDPSSPYGKHVSTKINSPIRYTAYGSYYAVIIDEHDPENFIWLNDMYGNAEKGFILERYHHNKRDFLIAAFEDRLVKLNVDMELIPFARARVKANKVLFFSTYGTCNYNKNAAIDGLAALNKKIADTERFLEELKLGRKKITESIG